MRAWARLILFLAMMAAPAADPPAAPSAAPAPAPPVPEPGRSVTVIPPRAERVTKVLRLGDLKYDELEGLLQAMLSPDGNLGYIKARNAIIVYDYPDNLKKIEQMLAPGPGDQPAVRNLRITVEFQNSRLVQTREASLKVDREPPKFVVRDGKVQRPRDVDVRLGAGTETTIRDTSQFVVTRSGSPARLWVGASVPDPNWLQRYRLVPLFTPDAKSTRALTPLAPADVPWRDVGAALEVLPIDRGDGLVDIEIFPVVTFIDKNGHNYRFRVQEVRTQVTVQPGQRLYIGGNDDATESFLNGLLDQGRIGKRQERDNLGIYLTVDFVQLLRGGRASPFPVTP